MILAAWGAFGIGMAEAKSVSLAGSIRPVADETSTVDVHHARISRRHLTGVELAARVEFELPLKLRNFEELEARLAKGETISADEMTLSYLPLPADYEKAAAWARAQGLEIDSDGGGLAVFGRGRIDQLQTAFGTTFARVAIEGSEFTSAIAAPALPQEIADVVVGVNGLQPHLHMKRHVQRMAQTPDSLSSNSAPYTPAQIARAYGANGLTYTGSGQTIAIVGETTPAASDLTTFFSNVGSGQSAANVTTVQVVTGTLPGVNTDAGTEATLDVEWASALAPASQIRVYATVDGSTTHFDRAYARILTDLNSISGLRQVSISYGSPEVTGDSASQVRTDDQYFAQLAAAGVSVFVSSGDGGSNPNNSGQYSASATLQAEFPASDGNVTAVGGTSLTLAASTGAISAESAWADGGGGSSIYISRPSWQTGAGVPAGSARLVPDVAAAGNPNTGAYVYWNNQAIIVGGTSWSAPTWAGFAALINQARTAAGLGGMGVLGPKIYPLLGSASFHDITAGSNGAYSAAAGYDECTGLGTPNVANLLVALGGVASSAPVATPPTITTNPASLSVTAGNSASFTVAVAGTAPFTYQWLKNGSAIAGATGATYTIASAATSNAGAYSVYVSNAGGAATSATAMLTVTAATTAPTLTANPASISVTAGKPAAFTVGVSGTAPFTYQWYKNGSALSGATSSSYVIAAAQSSDAGAYAVRVANAAGTVTSAAATLTVTTPVLVPSITASPVSMAVAWGAPASFSVTATGTGTLGYQWLHNGATLAGATGPTYAIAAAQATDAGTYSVVVSNAGGSATSGSATLAVNLAPMVSAAPVNQVGIDGSATTLSVTASGPNLSYQWYFNGAAIAGATASTLALSQLSTLQAGQYTVAVTNASGSVTASALVAVEVDSRLTNISSRAAVDEAHPLAVGFVVQGTGDKQLLVRGVGPGLQQFGITDALASPVLTLYSSAGSQLLSDGSWGGSGTLSKLFNAVGAFPLAISSADSAVAPTVLGGAYSAEITGAGASGVALGEIYDEDGATSATQLINLSSRGAVGTGQNALVAGFIIGGASSETVLLRAVGPGLVPFGVPDAASAPTLTVYDGGGNVITTVQGWDPALASVFAQVGAFGLTLGSADCAAVLNLAPGSYTMQMTGDSGTGLVEVYAVP